MDLIYAITKHLEEASNNSSFDEETQEYLQSAYECLNNIFEEKDTSAYNNKSLSSLWEENTKKTSTPTMTWEQFKVNLEQRGFFKNCSINGLEYRSRWNKAIDKYETKWPNQGTTDLKFFYEKMTKVELSELSAQADQIKVRGNKHMKDNQLDEALKSYSQAIATDPVGEKAHIYFANRATCHMKLKNYEDAILDAQESARLNPDYVKAHFRLANAYKMNDDTEEAIETYEKVLTMISKDEKIYQICQTNIKNLKATSEPQSSGGMPDLSQLGGLLGGLGGMGGPGGMGGLGELLKNPAMQKMAANMMKDPNAMAKMTEMMQDPEALKKMGSMFGQSPDKVSGLAKVMQENPGLMTALQDPVKREEIMAKLDTDPEVKELRKIPENDELFNRLKAKDMTAFQEIMGKPEIFSKLQKIMSKYV